MPSDRGGKSGLDALADRFPSLKRLKLLPDRRVPFVQQLTETECGAACLAMVAGFHGKDVSLEQVRDLCGGTRDGVSAREIVEGGSQLGMHGRGVRVEIEQLTMLPAGSTILHWEFAHFVVLAKVNPQWVEIVDPAVGPRRVPMAEFRKAFTGIALTFEPNALFQKQKRQGILYATIKDLILDSGLLPHILVMSLVMQLFGLAMPVLMGQLVDRVLPRGDLDLLVVLMVGLGVVIVFEALSELVRGQLLLQLRTLLDTRMTLGFLDHLVNLPYTFFQVRSAGDLMMRLNSNTTVREQLTSSTLSGILDGLLVVFFLVILGLGSPPMMLAAVCAALLDLAVYFVTRRKQRELTDRGLSTEAKAQGYEVEMLTSMETLKATGNEQRAVSQWSNLFVDALNVTLARDRLTMKTNAALGALRAASPLAIIAVGAMQVLEGKLSLGGMLALSAIAGEFLGPLSNLVQTAMSLQVVRGYLDRVNDVLEAPPEQDTAGTRAAGPLSGRITVEQVSFRYGPQAPLVVQEVSLQIEPGQFIAIVGRSGSGKSTLANLLLGLYRPVSGRVLFDGTELGELNLRSVRQQLGIVNQSVGLFGGTVRENISLADPDLPLEKVIAAAKLAGIHDEIMEMPMGYNTVLIERGASISGGQRQRIALARALVRTPAILLLDEATSALDAVSEKLVQASLHDLRATRIVIAHRLSTVKSADLIVVMDQGRVAEIGQHRALIAKNGPYAALVASQLSD